MRQEDLLREIRDAIRANTAVTQELRALLTQVSNPVYFVDLDDPATVPRPLEPGEAIRVEDRTGQMELFPEHKKPPQAAIYGRKPGSSKITREMLGFPDNQAP
jgi:hypothetical protein